MNSTDQGAVIWLEPWWAISEMGDSFSDAWQRRLAIEVPAGHPLYEIPVKIIARGNGDDGLFEILDGTRRVANVHLTWARSPERLPYPITTIYSNINEWVEKVMMPEHADLFK